MILKLHQTELHKLNACFQEDNAAFSFSLLVMSIFRNVDTDTALLSPLHAIVRSHKAASPPSAKRQIVRYDRRVRLLARTHAKVENEASALVRTEDARSVQEERVYGA